MSKPNPQPNSRRTLYIVAGLALVGALIYSQGGSGDAPTTKSTPPVAKKSDSTASDLFKPEDYKTPRYLPLKEAIKDNFQPLIGKPVSIPTDDLGIGIDLAGEEGWYYTGMVELNGKPEATLENLKTGETNFSGVGEAWKKARIHSISDYQVVMIDQKGKAVSVKMGQGMESKKLGADAVLSPAVAQPPLTGAIGPLTVSPMVVAPDPNAPSDPNGGANGGTNRRGRGRGRRNNGGNGAQGTDNGGQNGS